MSNNMLIWNMHRFKHGDKALKLKNIPTENRLTDFSIFTIAIFQFDTSIRVHRIVDLLKDFESILNLCVIYWHNEVITKSLHTFFLTNYFISVSTVSNHIYLKNTCIFQRQIKTKLAVVTK